MGLARLSKLELQIMEALWAQDGARSGSRSGSRSGRSIREIVETFPEPRPAYTTIQTTVYRLEKKQAVRRTRKIGNADIFEPLLAREATRAAARRRLLDEVLKVFGGRPQPMMAQLAETGKLTLEDVRELEKIVQKQEGSKGK